MDIQKIILGLERKIETELLYRVDKKDTIVYLEQGIQIKRGYTVCFDTYYNSFSTGKWKKYSRITHVGLRIKFDGKAILKILFSEKGKEERILKKFYINADSMKEEILEVGELLDKGVLFFSIIAMEDFNLYEAAWNSYGFTVNTSINLGITICTYKKENWVTDNINIINRAMKEGKFKIFSDKVHIFIADNGQTLDRKKMDNEWVRVIPNKNCGGVGGFTRGILEILQYNNINKKKISHVILMDDDVIIEPDIIMRTLLFLMCLKGEYACYSICGAMLYQENTCIQHASGEVWRNGDGIRLKANYNLLNFQDVVLNEKEEEIDYAGWFYCVIPIIEISRYGLPLPIFIHCDDIEYGLRMQGKFITLNGINIWHPNHKGKYISYIKYYDVRNKLIVNSIYADKFINTRRYVIGFLCRGFVRNILMYNYADTALMLQGVIDFCRGIDWLKETDAEKRHRKLLTSLSRLNPIISISDEITYENIKGKNRKWDYIKSAMNWIRPMRKSRIILRNDFQNIRNFIGVNSVIVKDNKLGQGYLYEKDYKKLLKLMNMLCHTIHIIAVRYPMCVVEYKNRINETSSAEFWEKYLDLIKCAEN